MKNTLNFGIGFGGDVHPTETSPNILTTEQVKFLQMLVTTKFFIYMTQKYFDEFLSLHGSIFAQYKKGYMPKNFHEFIINILKQGRYGNATDKNKLKFIRTIYIYRTK